MLFCLSRPPNSSNLSSWEDATTFDLFSPEDLNHNLEDGCSLLRIVCDDFSVVSSNVVGQKLNDVCLTMTGVGFRYQKLTLSFVPIHSRLESFTFTVKYMPNLKVPISNFTIW